MLARLVRLLVLAAAIAASSVVIHDSDLVPEDVRRQRREIGELAHHSLSPAEYRAKYRVTKRVFEYILSRIIY